MIFALLAEALIIWRVSVSWMPHAMQLTPARSHVFTLAHGKILMAVLQPSM